MNAAAVPALAAGTDEELDRRRLAVIAAQGHSLRWQILATVVVVAVLVAGYVPASLLAVWVAVAVILREWRAEALRRLDADTRRPIASRLSAVTVWNAALGISNGAAAGFMVWLDTTSSALLTMVLVSWAAGAVSTSAPLPRAYIAYTTCVFVPTALPWLWVGTPLSFGVAGLVLLFAGVQYRFLKQNAETFEQSYRIRLENEDLVRQLGAARDVAEAANRAKSRFLAAASHDLRQPLHALSLHSGLLVQDPGAPDAAAIAVEMAGLIQSLARLLDSLLDISKLDAGVVAVEKRPIRLRRLVEHLVRTHAPQAAEKGLRLRFDCDREVPIDTDPLLLERLLRNLVDNAIKYTPAGEVEIAVSCHGATVQVAVRDTGIGIPADAQTRVFEEFFQVGERSGERDEGLGLGLAIVHRLAALLEAPLALESEPGRGTTVTLSLRRADDSADDPAPAAAPEHGLQGLKVLLIDDEASVRRAMRGVLTRFGCVTAEAASAADAVARLRDFRPDLVLADCQLNGGGSGIDAVRQLREQIPGVAALLISGDTDTARRREAERSGLRLLHKPVTVERLRAAIDAALAQRGAGVDEEELR